MCPDSKSWVKTDCTEIVITGTRWEMPESLLRLKQQTGSIRRKRECGKSCSEQAIQRAGDSCWATLWRSWDSVCRHFCSNGGCVFVLIGKPRSSSIVSGLGEAWKTSLLDQPTSASNVTTSLSNSVCFGLWGQCGRQVKDEINNAEKLHVSGKRKLMRARRL